MTADDAHAAAVHAAAEALALIPGTTVAYPLSVARTVVAAVAPILAAAERQRIAAAIRAEAEEWAALGDKAGTRRPYPVGSPPWAVERAYDSAARIAEGEPT